MVRELLTKYHSEGAEINICLKGYWYSGHITEHKGNWWRFKTNNGRFFWFQASDVTRPIEENRGENRE